MTKNIVLTGGPEDGRTVTIDQGATTYIVVQPVKSNGIKIFLTSEQRGTYQQTGEYSGAHELFTWQGWE